MIIKGKKKQEFSEFTRAGIGYTNQYIISSVAQALAQQPYQKNAETTFTFLY